MAASTLRESSRSDRRALRHSADQRLPRSRLSLRRDFSPASGPSSASAAARCCGGARREAFGLGLRPPALPRLAQDRQRPARAPPRGFLLARDRERPAPARAGSQPVGRTAVLSSTPSPRERIGRLAAKVLIAERASFRSRCPPAEVLIQVGPRARALFGSLGHRSRHEGRFPGRLPGSRPCYMRRRTSKVREQLLPRRRSPSRWTETGRRVPRRPSTETGCASRRRGPS